MGKHFDDIFDHLTLDDIFPKISMTSHGQYEIVEEEDGTARIFVIAPGYKSENLGVEVHNGILTVKGEISDRPTKLIPPRVDLRFRFAHSLLVNQAIFHDGILEIIMVRPEQPNQETINIPITIK